MWMFSYQLSSKGIHPLVRQCVHHPLLPWRALESIASFTHNSLCGDGHLTILPFTAELREPKKQMLHAILYLTVE